MKKTFALKPLALSLTVAAASMATVAPATVQAGVSANAGLVSTYVFRGVLQTATEKATASAGVDYENDSGFYVGTWASSLDANSNLEYDFYAGWGGEFEGVSVGLGATGYYYTDKTADKFEEINFSLGYGPVSVAYDKGTTVKSGASNEWYTHKAISGEYEGFTGTYGVNSAEGASDVKYVQVDYGFEIAPSFDGSVSIIKTMKKSAADENYLILGVTKSFDIM